MDEPRISDGKKDVVTSRPEAGAPPSVPEGALAGAPKQGFSLHGILGKAGLFRKKPAPEASGAGQKAKGNLSAFLAFPKAGLARLDPRFINQGLFFILMALTALVVYLSILKRPDAVVINEIVSRINVKPVKLREIKPFDPVDVYLNVFNERNIFQPYQEQAIEIVAPDPEKVEAPPPKVSVQEMTQGMSLVGISWGSSPTSMIYSKNDGKVYFVKQGQFIGDTKVKVVGITPLDVTLEFEGDRMKFGAKEQ